MKVSGISIGDRAADAANTSAAGLLIFISRGNAKFHLEVSEHRDVVFPPFKFRDTESTLGPQVKNPCLPHHAHSTSGPSYLLSPHLECSSPTSLWSSCSPHSSFFPKVAFSQSIPHSLAKVAAPSAHRSSSPCSASSPHRAYHS